MTYCKPSQISTTVKVPPVHIASAKVLQGGWAAGQAAIL